MKMLTKRWYFIVGIVLGGLVLVATIIVLVDNNKDSNHQEDTQSKVEELSTQPVDPCANGHTEVIDHEIAPTCTQKGKTEGKHCSVCGEILVQQESVDAKGHTEVIDQAIELTCTQNGMTEGKHCSVCGKVLVVQQVLYTKGHSYVDNICSGCGDEYYTSGLRYVSNGDGTCYVDGVDIWTTVFSVVIPRKSPDGDLVTGIGEEAFYYCRRVKSFTLPNSITSIGKRAFAGCESLESIVIPDSVIRIGEGAFEFCGSLVSIELGDGLTDIGENAFDACKSLSSITIPSNVQKIGARVFSRCDSLVSISVDQNNSQYHSDGNCLIETNSKVLIAGCQSSTIPTDGSVTSLGEYAFYYCTHLTNITLPDKVTRIGFGAFIHCEELVSVILPNGFKVIDLHMFQNCTSLTSIIVPDSVTRIQNNAFLECTSLASVFYIGTSKDWSAISINSSGNDFLTSATRYYYSETQPTTSGNYWRYVDGVPTAW